MQPKICPANLPPPVASNASVAPFVASASVSSARNSGELASHTCTAPIARKSAACSGLRTMLTNGTPSCWQMRLSICPRLDAAAVCTSAACPSRRMVSTMPSAVSGFTKHEAPSAQLASSGSTRHWSAGMARNCEYIAPPRIATFLPSKACAAADSPAATTTPAPSLPTGIDCPMRAAMPFRNCGAMGAVTTGRSVVPEATAACMSAGPNNRPMSEGLIGAACIFTIT